MIKASLEPLMPVFIKLFNLILRSGKMPDIWCQGLITQSTNQVTGAIQQTIEEYVFLVVLENCFAPF